MKTLAFVRANKLQAGGAEIYLSRLLEELSRQGVQYRLINSTLPKFLPSWIRAFLFNLVVIVRKRGQFYFSLERITCPDIYRAGDGVHRVFLSKLNIHSLNPLHRLYLYIEKRTFQNAKAIIANSRMVKNDIMQTYDIPDEKIKVIYNGVKLKQTTKEQACRVLSAEFPLPAADNEKCILYVGSGFKRKGVTEFLILLSKLKSLNYFAFVVGKDKDMSAYTAFCNELGLSDRVIFTGQRRDVENFYHMADVLVLPTYYDPFANVVLEAMSVSTAVITTRQTGASEILDAKYIMDSPQDYSVCDALDELLMSPVALDKAKKHNFDVASQYTIERNVKETLALIDTTM